MRTMTADEVIAELRKRQGEKSLRQFSSCLGVSPMYLSDVYNHRREPGPTLCEALGLEKSVSRVVSYTPTEGTADDSKRKRK